MDKIQPILSKIELVRSMVEAKDKDKADYYKQNYSALPFIKSVKQQLMKNGKLSEKQMEALNKVYKRYSKGKDEEKN